MRIVPPRHILATFACLATAVLATVSGRAAETDPPAPAPSPAPISSPEATPAPTPAWLSRVNATDPGPFPPPRSFQAAYRLVWSGVEAGRAEVTCTSPQGAGVISTKITGGTVGLARTLYQVDGSHVAVGDRHTLRPTHLDQTELEAKKRKTAHVEFTPTEAQRTLEVTDRKSGTPTLASSGTTRKRTFRYPGMFDMLGTLYFVRSLPLVAGDSKTMITMTAGNPYLTTIRVIGRGAVKTVAGSYPAIECSIALSKINKQGELEPHKSFKSARVWISDDSDRMIVKAEAQVFVGSVTLDLTRIAFPGK